MDKRQLPLGNQRGRARILALVALAGGLALGAVVYYAASPRSPGSSGDVRIVTEAEPGAPSEPPQTTQPPEPDRITLLKNRLLTSDNPDEIAKALADLSRDKSEAARKAILDYAARSELLGAHEKVKRAAVGALAAVGSREAYEVAREWAAKEKDAETRKELDRLVMYYSGRFGAATTGEALSAGSEAAASGPASAPADPTASQAPAVPPDEIQRRVAELTNLDFTQDPDGALGAIEDALGSDQPDSVRAAALNILAAEAGGAVDAPTAGELIEGQTASGDSWIEDLAVGTLCRLAAEGSSDAQQRVKGIFDAGSDMRRAQIIELLAARGAEDLAAFVASLKQADGLSDALSQRIDVAVGRLKSK